MRILWLPCAKVLLDNATECKRSGSLLDLACQHIFWWTGKNGVHRSLSSVAGLDNLWYLLFWMAFWRCSFNVCNKCPFVFLIMFILLSTLFCEVTWPSQGSYHR